MKPSACVLVCACACVCVCVTLCSSVKPFEKREGGGAHNWGTVDDDLKAS